MSGAEIEKKTAALVRPAVAVMQGYIPGEQPGGRKVVKLNTNENPYAPSASVREAIATAAGSLQLYPDPTAASLRQVAGELWGVDPAGIVAGNGSDELLTLLMRAVVEPGQGVAYPTPTYSLYDTLVEIQGAEAVRVAYPDTWELPRALDTVAAKLFLICNPNAPSATAIAQARIEELLAARPDALIVVDEAYGDFAEASALSLVRRYPNLLVLRTLSKSYSLAGLRVGLAMTTPELARQLHKVRDTYNLSAVAQAGAIAALRDQPSFLANRARIVATRERLTADLRARGFEVPESAANFVLARRPGKSLEGLMLGLRDKGVLVRFFAGLPDAIRITVGTDAEIDALLSALG
jgi:histidinol-phosphate aminotransferase